MKLSSKKSYLILLFLIFLDLIFLFNKELVLLPKNSMEFSTISSFLGWSFYNNLIFISINVMIFTFIIYLIDKNIFYLKRIFNFNFLGYLLISVISIFIILNNLPYLDPLKIGNFGDVVHDSEKIAFLGYKLFDIQTKEILKNIYTLHGWFPDFYISYLALEIFNIDNIFYGLRAINTLVHILISIVFLFFIFFFCKKFCDNKNFLHLLTFFLSSFLILQFLGITAIIDRFLFVYLILISYLNFDFENSNFRKNYYLIVVNSLLILLSFFYNFYQFVAILLINTFLIILISYLFENFKYLLINLLSLLLLFLISLLFFDLETYQIGFDKISELASNVQNGTIYDFRYGYTISSSIFAFYIYLISLAFIIFYMVKTFYQNYSGKNLFQDLKSFLIKNIFLIIILLFSSIGFYQFLNRGICCSYLHSSNVFHYFIVGLILVNFIKKDKLVTFIFPFLMVILVVIFSNTSFKKKIYNNLKFVIKIQDINSTNDKINMKDNLGLFDVVNRIESETKNQDCFFSLMDDAFLQIKLKKKPCTSKPLPQDMRTEQSLNQAINQLKKNQPNFILFDIDNYSEYYSLGLRLEDDVRSTIYSELLIKYILKNYSPYNSTKGFHIWKINNEKKVTQEINVNMDNENIFSKSPKQICEIVKNKTELNCFIVILNEEKKIIDVVSGQINQSTILEVISLDQKHYFRKNLKKSKELSLIPNDLNDASFYLKTDNQDYLILQ